MRGNVNKIFETTSIVRRLAVYSRTSHFGVYTLYICLLMCSYGKVRVPGAGTGLCLGGAWKVSRNLRDQ